jgi:Flp pilus assembly pilin Flp
MQDRENFPDAISGATAIEYAMIAGGIALVVMGSIAIFGGQLSGILGAIAAALGA